MTTMNIILLIAVTLTAVSYGWGMRGDLIGGEEGAMLPGAFLGMFLAWFSGVPVIQENFLLFAAIGAASVFMGGTEPYAQTLMMVYWGEDAKPFKNVKKGMIGTLIKGAPWWGIAGAFFGIGFSAITGHFYKWYDIIILFALIIIFRAIGIKIFNDPYDPKEKKFPKLFYSLTSREEWGGLWFIMAVMAGYMIFRKDYFSLKMLAAGIISGSIGWVIANVINILSRNYKKTGKHNFGKLYGKYHKMQKLDSWKIMEFTYGALGALGLILCFIFNYDTIKVYEGYIAANSNEIWQPLKELAPCVDLGLIVSVVFIVLIVIDALQHAVEQPLYIGDIEEDYKAGKIIIYEYERLIKKASPTPVGQWYNKYLRFVQLCRRPLFSYSVLILCLLGAKQAAAFATIELLLWACLEEFCFVQLDKRDNSHKKGFTIASIILLTVVSVFHIILGDFGILPTFLLLAITYLFTTIYIVYLDFRKNIPQYKEEHGGKFGLKGFLELSGSSVSVKLHYIFCITLVTVLVTLGINGIL